MDFEECLEKKEKVSLTRSYINKCLMILLAMGLSINIYGNIKLNLTREEMYTMASDEDIKNFNDFIAKKYNLSYGKLPNNEDKNIEYIDGLSELEKEDYDDYFVEFVKSGENEELKNKVSDYEHAKRIKEDVRQTNKMTMFGLLSTLIAKRKLKKIDRKLEEEYKKAIEGLDFSK